MRISESELNRLIREEVMKATGGDEFSIPEGRDIAIVLKSLKSRVHYINFSKVPEDSILSSQTFKKLVANADKYNELFANIKAVVCGKLGGINGLDFASDSKNFQLSNDDSKVFLVIRRNFIDVRDNEEQGNFSEAISSLGDNMAIIQTEINQKISRFGMYVILQYYKQGYIIVTLNTPFDFAAYNKELDKYIR